MQDKYKHTNSHLPPPKIQICVADSVFVKMVISFFNQSKITVIVLFLKLVKFRYKDNKKSKSNIFKKF